MSFRHKKIFLLVLAILLITVLSGCRRPPRFPFPPPVIVDERPRYKASHYRYRYFPASQVYYDGSRKLYFYRHNNVWLSVPVLPRHIYIDMNNYVTVELEGTKPHRHHKKVVKSYPPKVLKKQNRQEYRDRKEDRREYKKDDRQEYRDRKEDRRDDKKDERQKYRDRKDDRRDDRKDDRQKYRDRKDDRREDKKDERQEYRDRKEDRRDDKKDRRGDYRDDENEDRKGKGQRRGNDKDDDGRGPGQPVWR